MLLFNTLNIQTRLEPLNIKYKISKRGNRLNLTLIGAKDRNINDITAPDSLTFCDNG